jgi:small nuclear ribonucleoprotein (snRNP)-like protein
MIDRPLDMLNNLKGQKVTVELKGRDKPLEGTLLAFDIHLNLVVELKDKKSKFIRGDIVETVNPA